MARIGSYIVTETTDSSWHYAVWRGSSYPNCSMVGVCRSLKSAKRLIRKDRKRWEKEKSGYPPVVYSEVSYPDLPDLRISEYAR